MTGTYYAENREKWLTYGENRRQRRASGPQCAAEALCSEREFASGLCLAHYKRWNRHGVLYSPKAVAGALKRPDRNRLYYEANRKRVLAYQKARRERDPDSAREYERAVYRRRRDKHQASNRARARKMGALDADSLAYDQIIRCDPCSYCSKKGRVVDHIDAVISGGANCWTNLTAACQPCNRKKWTSPLLEALMKGSTHA